MTAPALGVGMLGYAFMGKAHSRGLRALRELDVPRDVRLVSICGRDRDAAATVAARFGWEEVVTDWREQVADERIGSGTGVTIRLTITEGQELVAFLDLLTLAPHQQVTRVYEVPGTKLSVFADAAGGTGTDALDVLIYGWKE